MFSVVRLFVLFYCRVRTAEESINQLIAVRTTKKNSHGRFTFESPSLDCPSDWTAVKVVGSMLPIFRRHQGCSENTRIKATKMTDGRTLKFPEKSLWVTKPLIKRRLSLNQCFVCYTLTKYKCVFDMNLIQSKE